MTQTYRFDYLPCRTCHAKVNCGVCENGMRNSLRQYSFILSTEIIIQQKLITVEADTDDEDEIIDALEEAGLFVD